MTQVRSVLRWLGSLLLTWGALPPVPGPEPVPLTDEQNEALRALFVRAREEPDIISAVFKGYVCYGLPPERFGPDFDLAETGKLYDVLGYASQVLEIAGERRTVCEVVDYLRNAA